jgi:ComF family protein
MFSSVWSALFPSRCLICSGQDLVRHGVCGQCRSRIQKINGPTCEICGKAVGMPGICLECQVDPPPYNRLLSVCRYEGLIRDVIHRFKYRKSTVFKKFLAEIIFEALSGMEASPDILTFVPLHWSRMIRRGYNQSALIARELSGYMGMGVRYGILRKTRNTQSQVGLEKKERERNLRSAFSARDVEGKSVMVVDDVITTGQTAREVSKALKRAGASQIIFVSIGRTVL